MKMMLKNFGPGNIDRSARQSLRSATMSGRFFSMMSMVMTKASGYCCLTAVEKDALGQENSSRTRS